MVTREGTIYHLNYLIKSYGAVTKLIAQTEQRLKTLPGENLREKKFESMLKGEGKEAGLETVKGRYLRAIEKELPLWDIWPEWLEVVPGIGPSIAGGLILLWYYRFVPICKDCGADLEKRKNGERNSFFCKGCGKQAKDGSLSYRIEYRDFPTISKWWKFMGRHTVNGRVPRQKTGERGDWSAVGKQIGYQIGEQFNRHVKDLDHPYAQFILQRKMKYEKNHPEWSKGNIQNAAINDTVKLFLAHFWTVARTFDGNPVSQPYAGAIMGHTNIIEPFYWKKKSQGRVEIHRHPASQDICETQISAASH